MAASVAGDPPVIKQAGHPDKKMLASYRLELSPRLFHDQRGGCVIPDRDMALATRKKKRRIGPSSGNSTRLRGEASDGHYRCGWCNLRDYLPHSSKTDLVRANKQFPHVPGQAHRATSAIHAGTTPSDC